MAAISDPISKATLEYIQKEYTPEYINEALKVNSFYELVIPYYMHQGVISYICHGGPPGGFLFAVLCNDLHGAVAHADVENLRNLAAYPAFLNSYAPRLCWRSEHSVQVWLESWRLFKKGELL